MVLAHANQENVHANIIAGKGLKASSSDLKVSSLRTAAAGRSAQDVRSARGRTPGLGAAPMLSVGSVSELSVDSRFSERAAPRFRGLAPSSAELERSYMERKQQEVRQMRARNERSCREAIHCPDVPRGAGTSQRSASLTVPSEFGLSASRATTPARSAKSDACSDAGSDAGSDSDCGSEWSHSLRRRSHRSKSQRHWRPQLTVPQGPALHTSSRTRSSSAKRGAESQPAASGAASWCSGLRSGSATPRGGRSSSRLAPPSPSPSMHSAASCCSARSARSRSESRARSQQPGRERGVMETPSPNRSVVAASRSPASTASDMSLCMSDVSRASRYPRLSRRSCSSKCHLSTEERVQAEVQAARQKLQSQIRRNEKSCRDAIHNPDIVSRQRSGSVTVPEEFNLSVGSARGPFQRPGSRADPEPRDWSRSLRQPSSQRGASREASVQRGLTMPEAPQLLTARRTRSTSAEPRQALERPTMSQHELPREQAAIESHLGRVASARTFHQDRTALRPSSARPQQAAQPPPGTDRDAWVRQEQRAQRARAAAQARHEQALAAEKERVCVFKESKPAEQEAVH